MEKAEERARLFKASWKSRRNAEELMARTDTAILISRESASDQVGKSVKPKREVQPSILRLQGEERK